MKKIFLLLLIIPTLIFADDFFFYVETPEIQNSYYNIFNAIAMIFQSDNYLELLRLVFLFGGFFTFAGGIISSWGKSGNGALAGYTKYLFVGMALLSFVFSHRSTMIVKSEGLPNYCIPGGSGTSFMDAIDNFPTVLAYGFTFTNRFGREMTRLAETAYANPAAPNGSTSMTSSGGYMGSLKEALMVYSIDLSRISLTDNNGTREPFDLSSMNKNLFSQCILIPYSSKGQIGEDYINKIKASGDIKTNFDELFTGAGVDIGGINSKEYTLEVGGETWTCENYYAHMQSYMQIVLDEIPCAMPEIGGGALQLMTGNASAPISEFQGIALQSGLVADLEASSQKLGIGVSGSNYASGKSRAEFIQSNMASGAYMAEMLPYIQMTLRAVLYAFFPFVFVVVMLPGGLKVITQYMQSLIWLELWSPTAAILNMFICNQAETRMAGEYTKHGLTMVNSIDMLSTGSTIAGVAGYLYASVPALTWLILKGSAQMLGNVTGAVGAGMAKNIQTDAINKDKQLIEKNKEQNATSDKDFTIAEMQHYQAVQDGRKEGAVLGQQVRAGMDTVVEAGALKEARGLQEYSELKKRMDGSGTASSIATMAQQLSAPNAYKASNEAKAFSNMTESELISAGQEEVKKQMGNYKGMGSMYDNNMTSLDDYKALTMSGGAKAVQAKAAMEAEVASHDGVIKKEEARRGHSMSQEEKESFVMARAAQYGGYKESYAAQASEQFLDKVMGTANQLDPNNPNGLKGASHSQLEGMGAVARLTGDTTYRDTFVKNLTTQGLDSGPNAVSIKDHASANVTQQNVTQGRMEGEVLKAKVAGQSVREQSFSSNLTFTSNKNGEKTMISLDEGGNIIAQRGITGKKLEGLGDRQLQNVIGIDAYQQLVAVKEAYSTLKPSVDFATFMAKHPEGIAVAATIGASAYAYMHAGKK